MSNQQTRALMALYDPRDRLPLVGGYWLCKTDDNRWQIGKDEMFLGISIDTNVPVGRGGSIDAEMKRISDDMLDAVNNPTK